MPITGHFEADFSQFNTGIKEATGTLDKFAKDTTATAKEVDKLGAEAPANIKKITTETKTSTQSFVDMGGVVKQISGMIAGAFTVQAIVNFGASILEMGSNIQKMAGQTGMATDEVQRLQAIAEASGVSMASLVSASQDVTAKLGSGDAGLLGALSHLNLNLEDFQKLSAYQRMVELGTAIGGVKDPTDRSARAAEVFGRNWKEIIPALNEQMRLTGDAASVMSDKMVKAADESDRALKDAQTQLKIWGGAVVVEISHWGDALGQFISRFGNWRQGFQDNVSLMKQFADENDPTGFLRAKDAIGSFNEKLGKTAPLQLPVIEGFKGIKLSAEQAGEAAKETSKGTAELIEANRKHVEAEKDAYAALDAEFRKQKADLDALIDRIKGNDVVAAAEQWAKAMQAVGEDVSKLSATMRDDLGTSMRAAIEAMARNGTLTSDQALAYGRLLAKVDEYNASLKKQAEVVLPAASGATTDYTQKLYDEARAQDAVANATAAANAQRAAALGAEMAAATGGGGGSGRIGYLAPRGTQDYNASMGATTSGSGAGSSYYTPPRAAGGPVSAGTSYLVGERGPELFTPSSSGMISASGNITNVFHLVDTESNLARKVSDLIMRSVTQARRV